MDGAAEEPCLSKYDEAQVFSYLPQISLSHCILLTMILMVSETLCQVDVLKHMLEHNSAVERSSFVPLRYLPVHSSACDLQRARHHHLMGALLLEDAVHASGSSAVIALANLHKHLVKLRVCCDGSGLKLCKAGSCTP